MTMPLDAIRKVSVASRLRPHGERLGSGRRKGYDDSGAAPEDPAPVAVRVRSSRRRTSLISSVVLVERHVAIAQGVTNRHHMFAQPATEIVGDSLYS